LDRSTDLEVPKPRANQAKLRGLALTASNRRPLDPDGWGFPRPATRFAAVLVARMVLRMVSSIAAFGLSAGACGLETSGLLFGGQTGGVNEAGEAGTVGSGGDEAGGVATGSGGRSDGATRDVVMSDRSVDSGLVRDAAAASGPDGSVASTSSGGVSQDSGASGIDGPDGGSAVLACGNQLLCALPGQTCCVGWSNGTGQGGGQGGGPSTLACENGATCGDPTATALHCAAAADCAAPQVCCLSQQSSPATSQCNAQCGNGDVQLCDSSAQTTGCGGKAACMAAQGGGNNQLPDGVGTCG
jgi:hypothetical protein